VKTTFTTMGGSANVVDVAPGDWLTELWREAVLSTTPAPEAARIAVMMRKAGRDLDAIAEKLGVPRGQIWRFINAYEAVARQNAEKAARELGPDLSQPPARPVVEHPAPVQPVEGPEEELDEVASASQGAPPQADVWRQHVRPDVVELTPLQAASVRRLRREHVVPVEVIARVMRLDPGQVLRASGECP
jgi:hypothetical protein